MITVSSHKIEGPKGVGALVVDNKVLKSKGLVLKLCYEQNIRKIYFKLGS